MLKKKSRRAGKQINAGSMADIAFLLLIFFLVTTTINAEKGIPVKLPPWVDEPVTSELNNRNILSVKVNAENQLLVEGEQEDIAELKTMTMEFITNPEQRKDMPASPRSAIVSLQNDRGTSYDMYIQVYNELKAAYHQLWNEKAKELSGVTYEELSIEDKKKVQKEIPFVISEAEPTNFGEE